MTARSARRRALAALVRLLIVVSALAVLAAGTFAWALTRLVADNITVLPAGALADYPDRPARLVSSGQTAPVSVLVIGSDRREGKDVGGGVTGERADAIMLVRLSGDRRHIDVLGIPRDAWVDIPGHGQGKINATLSYGGVPLVLRTVEGLLGIRMDHVLVADFEAVRTITTDLGGIEVTNPTASTDPLTRTVFPAGTLVLDGDRAMTWVRQLYALPGGDLDRIVRQQQLISGILDRISGPGDLRTVVTTASKHLTVDEDLTVDRMTELLAAYASVPGESVRYFTAPTTGTAKAPDGQEYLVLDKPLLTAAGKAINTDTAVPLPSNVIP